MKGTATNGITWSIVNARLPRDEYSEYYRNQLNQFCEALKKEKTPHVQFGKQDIRGGHSITVFYPDSCCTGLKYFNTFKELLTFVEGFNASRDAYFLMRVNRDDE